MSIEDRFNAAVNVIRGLPKNGSYQPSNEMMLKFYSYYKQATKGQCEERKPAFWDVVSRAKWDAWMRLGEMSKEKAMQRYVEELKKIVETMSYTDNVANFMGSINELDNVNVVDLELIAPAAIQKVRSRPNSPFASRDTSPIRPTTNGSASKAEKQAIPSIAAAATIVNGYHQQNGNGHANSDQSDDEYIDTVDDSDAETTFRPLETQHVTRMSRMPVRSVQIHSQSGMNAEVAAQLARTVERMNVDLQQVNNRINIVERALSDIRLSHQKLQKQHSALEKYPNWWPFNEISPKLLLFIILWPFIANRLANIFRKRK